MGVEHNLPYDETEIEPKKKGVAECRVADDPSAKQPGRTAPEGRSVIDHPKRGRQNSVLIQAAREDGTHTVTTD